LVLVKWIATAEQCRKWGDEVSWKAILAAVTCPAVARLEKTWRRVDDELVKEVREWVNNPEVKFILSVV
jgi:GTPase-activating protein BEM2